MEVITDDRALKGEFILQLLPYKEKPKVIEDNEGSSISLTPIDTTYAKSSKHKSTIKANAFCFDSTFIWLIGNYITTYS